MIEFIEKTEIENRKNYEAERIVEKDISEFLESGRDACVVDISRYKNVLSAYSAYSRAIKGTGCRCMQRSGKLYLLRE